MRLIRYQTIDGEARPGWIHEDRVGPLEGSLFQDFIRLDAELSIDEIRILPPIQPTKIICVGRNFAAHAKEHDAEVPKVPLLFFKPTTAVIGQNDPIILPPQSKQVEHEAELAVVLGRGGRWINIESAWDYVFGYTIANDVTARDLQRLDGQWTRAKGFDTFCPIGPWVETEFDPSDVLITCKVNNETRQISSSRDMVFSIPQIIAFASSFMTLEPGDLILTGTPAGVSPLNAGDIVEVSIEGLGTLKNPVISETNR